MKLLREALLKCEQPRALMRRSFLVFTAVWFVLPVIALSLLSMLLYSVGAP